jgi:type III secretory pathway component EscT
MTLPDIKEKVKKQLEKLSVWSLHYREYIVGFAIGFVIGAIVL